VSRILKKYHLRREYLKLEEEDIREELSSYNQTFETIFGKYFKGEVWVNDETGQVTSSEPTEEDVERLKQEHFIKEKQKERQRQRRVKESRERPDKIKRLYKKLAAQLHPDKGGSDSDFQRLNESYHKNDLIDLLTMAGNYDLEYEIDEVDEKTFQDNLKSIEKEITRMKDTLSWLWSKGTVNQKKFVIAKIEQITGKQINKNDFKDLFESE